ncbi:MAG: hypothetical protein IPP29_25135 [Bacteroidetes bacterium]|nr:hypothetical protein [Bacteroidota bacterium]
MIQNLLFAMPMKATRAHTPTVTSMEQRPHSLLMGMMIAGYITGQEYGVVYIRGEYPESITIIDDCIKQLYEMKLLDKNHKWQ